MEQLVLKPRKILLVFFWIAFILTLAFSATRESFYLTHDFFSMAITFDFVLLIPLIYFFTIRKSSVPNITVLPVFVLSLILASYLIPETYHDGLDWLKLWVLPILELGVITLVILQVIKIRKALQHTTRGQEKLDFHDAIQQACVQVFPGLIGRLLSSELSMIYYGFLTWSSTDLLRHEFSTHKKSGVITILYFIIGLVVAETFVLHLLISRWNMTVAWVITGISIYSGLQVFGFIKSIPRRPIELSDTGVKLRCGILSQVELEWDDVRSVVQHKKDLPEETDVLQLSPLGYIGGGHNVLLEAKQSFELTQLFGIKKKGSQIVFHVDDPDRFIQSADEYLR